MRLETATPTETEKTIAELKKQLCERDDEIAELKKSVEKIEKLTGFLNELNSQQMADFFEFRKQRNESLIEPFEKAGKITLAKKPTGTVLRIVLGDTLQDSDGNPKHRNLRAKIR